MADAVHHAHKHGLIHRDLKPANVLVDQERRPHVADFGLGLHESEQWNQIGKVVGTPSYMSPEQVRGESHRLDGRSDIWSLGVILYEVLTSRHPFASAGKDRLFDEIISRDPKPMRQIDETIDPELDRIVARCLAKSMNERYATASDLAADLRLFLDDSLDPTVSSSSPVSRSLSRRFKRGLHGTASIGNMGCSVSILVACLFIAVALWWVYGRGTANLPIANEPPPAPQENKRDGPRRDLTPWVYERGNTPQNDPATAEIKRGRVPDEREATLGTFKPPALAELDAKANWEDQPVVDPMQLLRDRQATEKPLVSVAEALRLKNDSAANNARILSALGRLPASPSQADYEARITRHTRADVKSTNPILASSTIEFDVGGLISVGLFGFDWKFNLFATTDTVKSWQASSDRMYDKVVMRDDLTWSNGRPITAHDVAFSFQTIMNPRVPVPAVRSGAEKLLAVHAYDDHTLVFFHKEPLATNTLNLSFPIIPQHIYHNSLEADPTLQDSPHHVKYENDPVCGGPYAISRRVRDQEIVLTRREEWYMHNGQQVREKPFFKQIRYRVIKLSDQALLALKGQDLDEMELSPAQWTTQTGDEDFYRHNTKATGLEWSYYYFGWNNDPQKAAFFTDRRVRTAMSYALDHDELLQKLLYGLYEPGAGIFHRTAWMAPQPPLKPYKQDLDKAETLLDEAGWEDHDGDGIRDKEIKGRRVKFEFTMLCSEDPLRKRICELFRQNLAQVGVVCHVRPMEFTVLQEKWLNHDFQAYIGGWGTGVDPDKTDNLWATGAGS